MRASGSVPSGADPDPHAARALEEARRRLYRPGGGTEAALGEYLLLAAPVVSEEGSPSGAANPGGSAQRRAPVGARVLVPGAAVAAVLLVLVLVVRAAPAPRPRVPPPLEGTTLLVYERSADPATDARSVTYQPEGYTVFQPRGRVVAVALTCTGRGRVRISAGQPFEFDCTPAERTMRLMAATGSARPFVIVGRTVGDVAWIARIVLLDRPRTSGAVPALRTRCASCRVVGA